MKFDWSEIASEKTVIVIGAGASQSCFGLPGWDDLKCRLNDLDVTELLNEIEDLSVEADNEFKEALNEFRALAKEPQNGGKTLDSLTYMMDKPKEKHFAPTGHRVLGIAGYLLAKDETRVAVEDISCNWVSDFRKVLQQAYVSAYRNNPEEAAQVVNNLTVVSLNYDRIFEYFISQDFYRDLYGSDFTFDFGHAKDAIEATRKPKLSVLKPHGYIAKLSQGQRSHEKPSPSHNLTLVDNSTTGTRYPGSDYALEFGSRNASEARRFKRMGLHMYTVDERGDSDYRKANLAIGNASKVFLLGLSSEGITQSKLELKSNQDVYLTNKQADMDSVELHYDEKPNFVRLSNSDSRYNIENFASLFT